jgi:Tfp pilus assembly protein FimV
MNAKKINCFILFFILMIPFKMSYADVDSANQHALSILMNEFKIAKRALKTKPGKIAPGQRYTIAKGDTLKGIALKAYGTTNLSIRLVRNVIMKENPKAFFRGNENYLFAGKMLKIPSVDDIRKHVFSSTSTTKRSRQSKRNWLRFP